MTGLRLVLVVGWTAIVFVTAHALVTLGVSGFVDTVLEDIRHPWRQQFYLDFELHLLLFAGWIAWRERFRASGLVCAVATLLLGALFTLPYLLVTSVRAGGDPRRLLLGKRA